MVFPVPFSYSCSVSQVARSPTNFIMPHPRFLKCCQLATSEGRKEMTQGGVYKPGLELEHIPSTHFALPGTLNRATPIHGGLGNAIQLCVRMRKPLWCLLSSLSHRLNHLISSFIWRQGFYLEGNTTK